MAVPRGGNGLIEEDDALFEDDGVVIDPDVPQPVRDYLAAAEVDDVDGLRSSLDNLNCGIDDPLEDGDTALHLACLYGYQTAVEVLLERGANLEVTDVEGAIPLHDACAGGYTEIARLIFNKANGPQCVRRMLDSADIEGDTPLHHAARGEHAETITYLLGLGASLTKTNIYGKKPYELPDPETDAKKILEAALNAVRS